MICRAIFCGSGTFWRQDILAPLFRRWILVRVKTSSGAKMSRLQNDGTENHSLHKSYQNLNLSDLGDDETKNLDWVSPECEKIIIIPSKGAYTRAMFQCQFCPLEDKTGWGTNLADSLALCDWLQLRERALHARSRNCSQSQSARESARFVPQPVLSPRGQNWLWNIARVYAPLVANYFGSAICIAF